jgi:uncharacterized protein DUF1588/uncharacterized protein DUF1592/uncharacterized protein DUF1587/uncharacterized protein DUF1585/uncharacterized protein DUF1595
MYRYFLILLLACMAHAETPGTFENVQSVLKTYCVACHQGQRAAARIDLTKFDTSESIIQSRATWTKVLARVRGSEMPPKGSPMPDIDAREKFVSWVEGTLRQAACAAGPAPGPSLIRRLNRDEYSATIRDLLNIQISAGHALPADGAGGEGFDNAAETLFLSPIHAEKYLEAARQALDYAMKDPRAREVFLIAEPSRTVSPEQAARKILEAFLPRAFRRPVSAEETERYLALFKTAQARKEPFDESIVYALQGVLISPHFLFRRERPNPDPQPRLLDDYEIASRLSYFIWGSLPDKTLFDLAAQGKLKDPAVLKEQATRLLNGGTPSRDEDKVRVVLDGKLAEFATRFIEQWLGTRELGRDIKPDPKLFPEYYDAELQAAIRFQPILFFQELLASNLSLLNLIESNFTFVNTTLNRHYKLNMTGLRQQPFKRDLPADSHRGGLLGMAAIAAVSSYPNRTSPVLRGKWVLDAMLGTPPPPPPPDIPALPETHAGEAPRTTRERLMQHRENAACGACHNRIDPIGFGLENYDVLGRWRTEDGGKPIDSKGELPDGTTFDGPDQLKAVLLGKKDLFIRHLTSKMLGYALGRGLTLEDSCTVDQIVADLQKNDYKAHTLIQGIVLSVPFRYQAGSNPRTAVPAGASKGEQQ